MAWQVGMERALLMGMNAATATETLLTAALNLNFIYAADLIKHLGNGDAAALIEDVSEHAAALQHAPKDSAESHRRNAWFAARDAVAWLSSPIASETEDKFGFKAATRAKSVEALAAVGIAA